MARGRSQRRSRGARESSRAASYVVVVGDLAGSRTMAPAERRAVQRKLIAATGKANRCFAGELTRPFEVIGGDGFQAVLSTLHRTPEMVGFWRRNLHPHRVRFGIGEGRLYSGQVAESVELMDGECFHRSADALEMARARGPSVVYNTGREALDLALETIFRLLETIQEGWKEIHYRRFWLYRELQDLGRVAAREGVTKAAVSQSLRTAKYASVMAAERTVARLLQMEWPKQVVVKTQGLSGRP